MKTLHWILFSIAVWIGISPFLIDELVELFLPQLQLTEIEFINLFRWDDLFLGLAIFVIGLIVVTLEQATTKQKLLHALHWPQIALGLWIAVAPFALQFTLAQFTISHVISGSIIAILALIQIYNES